MARRTAPTPCQSLCKFGALHNFSLYEARRENVTVFNFP